MQRRRTQIRLAQRAYRQRKETTISSLKGQNERLQKIINQMNNSFLQFNEAALKSGLLQLNMTLAQQLKSVTESFVLLARSAAEGHDDQEEVVEPSEEENAVPKQVDPVQTDSIPTERVDVGWGYSAALETQSLRLPTQPSIRNPPHDAYSRPPVLPHFNTEQEEREVVQYRRPKMPDLFNQGVSWASPPLGEQSSDQSLPFGLVNILDQQHSKPPSPPIRHTYSVNIPTPRTTPPLKRIPTPPYPSLSTKTIKPVWTYSHDETTFARRLMRATIEAGFHLLGSASQRPVRLDYVFRLSLPYATLNDLRERFRMLLARGTDEDLDFWETPFIHLGGAGTHYPRRDMNGNVIKKPNTWTVRRIGPIEKKMIRAENSEDPTQSHDLNIDLTGFEGEWFDADDVEGYLQHEKGVRIDPKNSFQDALVDDDEQDDYFDMTTGEDGLAYSTDRSTPSFSTASSNSDAHSSGSTPTDVRGVTKGGVDHLFAQPNIPFGLDMSMPSEFSKVPAIDSTAFFEQQLGLDLVPGFDMGVNNTSLPPTMYPSNGSRGSALGTGMHVQGTEKMTVVRQRKKKAVLIDISKLISGKFAPVRV